MDEEGGKKEGRREKPRGKKVGREEGGRRRIGMDEERGKREGRREGREKGGRGILFSYNPLEGVEGLAVSQVVRNVAAHGLPVGIEGRVFETQSARFLFFPSTLVLPIFRPALHLVQVEGRVGSQEGHELHVLLARHQQALCFPFLLFLLLRLLPVLDVLQDVSLPWAFLVLPEVGEGGRGRGKHSIKEDRVGFDQLSEILRRYEMFGIRGETHGFPKKELTGSPFFRNKKYKKKTRSLPTHAGKIKKFTVPH
jgi:hypothetical protein